MNRLRIILLLLGSIALAPAGLPASQSPVDAARSLFDAGRYADAQSLLNAEISKSANQAVLYYWLARSSFELKQNDQAVKNAERAVELSPRILNSITFLALLPVSGPKPPAGFRGSLLRGKLNVSSLKQFELDPNNIPAQRDLINYYIAAPGIAGGGEDKAEEQFKRLDAINSVQAHLARIGLYHNQKKWSQAVEEANSVIAAKPMDAGPYLEIADYYASREGGAGMRTALTSIPSTAAHDRRQDYYRGVADVIAGDNPRDAESLLKTYIAGGPVHREDHAPLSAAHTWLGRLYEKTGRRSEAIAEYHTALDLDAKDKAAHEGLKRLGG